MKEFMKIVEFQNWCPKCKYFKVKDNDEPCDSCLEEPVRIDSHKPVNFEASEKEK